MQPEHLPQRQTVIASAVVEVGHRPRLPDALTPHVANMEPRRLDDFGDAGHVNASTRTSPPGRSCATFVANNLTICLSSRQQTPFRASAIALAQLSTSIRPK